MLNLFNCKNQMFWRLNETDLMECKWIKGGYEERFR